MTDGPPIPYMKHGNLVTVNDLWSPIPYMECGNFVMGSHPHAWCGNLVTVNDSYSPPIPYMKCRNLVTGFLHMYDMIWMWEPCNCQWWEPCNRSPHMYDMIFSGWQWWKLCNGVPPHVQCNFFRMTLQEVHCTDKANQNKYIMKCQSNELWTEMIQTYHDKPKGNIRNQNEPKTN